MRSFCKDLEISGIFFLKKYLDRVRTRLSQKIIFVLKYRKIVLMIENLLTIKSLDTDFFQNCLETSKNNFLKRYLDNVTT